MLVRLEKGADGHFKARPEETQGDKKHLSRMGMLKRNEEKRGTSFLVTIEQGGGGCI